jgi:prepilin-type N-terminal cleavage/methylation domain-containing protein
MAGSRRGARARAGFTLIELMAVIVILGILTAALVVGLGKAGEEAKRKATAAFLVQLEAAIGEYEQRFGDFPPSQWQEEWGSAPNPTNLGGECLVLSLWSPKWGGVNLRDDRLVNTDADETKKSLSRIPKPALFELKDEWDNPIAYLHRRDYEKQQVYLATPPDSNDALESTVRAERNPATGQPFNPTGYQLRSAGPDGEFGTADDIGNWTRPRD